ncbi:hypothetical protein J7M28_10665 [bacterium]|nr:hypothetical protein [bacterium]
MGSKVELTGLRDCTSVTVAEEAEAAESDGFHVSNPSAASERGEALIGDFVVIRRLIAV